MKEMISKIYEKCKQFIKDSYLYLCFYFVLFAVMWYPLPYYIYSGGGLINLEDRVEVRQGYPQKGSFHLCYVTEIDGSISSYLLGKLLGWDIVPIEQMQLGEEESSEDIFLRDRLFMDAGNSNAIMIAYQKAGKTFKVTGNKNYVFYLDSKADTTLKIGDDIQKIDGKDYEDLSQLKELVSTKDVGDVISFTVIRDGKTKEAEARVYEEENGRYIGVAVQNDLTYETNPEVELRFSKNEAGSSGGLMLTLAIYNQLVEEDITGGLKIAGTGTIERDGSVGPIGGVKYKLKGAVSKKAKIFFVPNGDNYKEAMEEKEKKHYDIDIVGVDNFDEALSYLTKRK